VTTRLSESWVRVLSLAGTLLIWELLAAGLDRRFFPTPWVVLESLWRSLAAGPLLYHLGITLARVAVSFVLAMAVGTACGIFMGRYRWVDAGLDGLLILGLNIPALVTAILCYIWFGLGEVAAVTAVALNKLPTVIVTVREGARGVDRGLLDVAQVFQLPRRRTFLRIYLPQLYPYLMAATRSGLALIWKIVLVVELLGRSNGIGFQLGIYFQFFDITSILAYTLAFATTVLLVEAAGLRPLERRLHHWRP
jgi:ABC-type nitrate/sulfonate/bicarbonate transport system permease component